MELRSINTLLTMLISFTSTATWKLLSGKAGDVLRPAMNQLCSNILSHLKDNGFYSSMEVKYTLVSRSAMRELTLLVEYFSFLRCVVQILLKLLVFENNVKALVSSGRYFLIIRTIGKGQKH